jgi:hypothetical protein
METFELCAYHESGRIVAAYMNGYICEQSELSELDAGSGKSVLNSGADAPIIQIILQRNTSKPSAEITDKEILVANKLLEIFSMGTCTALYYENDKSLNEDIEISFPGQDISQLELIMTFLRKNDPTYTEDRLNNILNSNFTKLQKAELSKPIEALAKKFLGEEAFKLNRFQIEDTLKSVGFNFPEKKVSTGFSVSLAEEKSPSRTTVVDPNAEIESKHSNNDDALNTVLSNFISNLNKELNKEEISASVKFLKDVFSKFG